MLCTCSCRYHWIGSWVQTSPARIWSGSTCRRCCQARWRLAGLQWCTWWLFIISTGSSTSTLTPITSSSSWNTGLSGGLSSYRMRWEMISIHGTNMLAYIWLNTSTLPDSLRHPTLSLSIFSHHLKAHFLRNIDETYSALYKFTLYFTLLYCNSYGENFIILTSTVLADTDGRTGDSIKYVAYYKLKCEAYSTKSCKLRTQYVFSIYSVPYYTRQNLCYSHVHHISTLLSISRVFLPLSVRLSPALHSAALGPCRLSTDHISYHYAVLSLHSLPQGHNKTNFLVSVRLGINVPEIYRSVTRMCRRKRTRKCNSRSSDYFFSVDVRRMVTVFRRCGVTVAAFSAAVGRYSLLVAVVSYRAVALV